MPVLNNDSRRQVTTSFPSVPDSVVVMYDEFTAGDEEFISNLEGSGATKVLSIVMRLMKSWNMTDEHGEELPINLDTIRLLNGKDVEFVLKATRVGNELLAKGEAELAKIEDERLKKKVA